MNYLIIDTTSISLTIIVGNGDKAEVLFENNKGKHNPVIMNKIDALLTKCNMDIRDIDVFGCVVGAGSFTGIRIAVNIINAFASVRNAKLVSIDTFEMIAYGKSNVMALIEARKDVYYCAVYENGKLLRRGEYLQADIDICSTEKVFRKNIDYSENLIKILLEKVENNNYVNQLEPLYLKKSQAERERAVMTCRLVPLEKRHLEQLLLIENEAFEFPEPRKYYSDMIGNDDYSAMVLESDEGIFGFAGLVQIYDEVHIMTIAVAKSMRRMGYGKTLVDFVINEAVKRGCLRVVLETAVNNLPAQELYSSYGFVRMALRPKYYGGVLDAYTYVLDIGGKDNLQSFTDRER